MQLRAGSPARSTSYDVDGVRVFPSDSVKDLGFHYNSNLDFSEHVRVRCRQAIMRAYHIFTGLCSNNESILLWAYKSYVRPIVESSVTVFSPLRKKEIYCIERVQNYFTRKLLARTGAFSCHRIPSAVDRNRLPGLRSLAFRRKLLDVCTAHKLLHHRCTNKGINMKQLFILANSRTRGAMLELSLPRPKPRVYANSLRYRAGSAYLRGTKNISKVLSPEQFKQTVSKSLLGYYVS